MAVPILLITCGVTSVIHHTYMNCFYMVTRLGNRRTRKRGLIPEGS